MASALHEQTGTVLVLEFSLRFAQGHFETLQLLALGNQRFVLRGVFISNQKNEGFRYDMRIELFLKAQDRSCLTVQFFMESRAIVGRRVTPEMFDEKGH